MDGAKRDAGKIREIAQAFRRLQEAYAALEKALPLPLDAPERRAVRQAAVEALDLAARSLPLLIDCRARFGYTPASLWQDWRWDILERWVPLLPLTLAQKMQQGVVTSRLYEPFCEEGWIGQLEGWADKLDQQRPHPAEVPWDLKTLGYASATQIVREYNGKDVAPGLPARVRFDSLRLFILKREDVPFMRNGRRLRIERRAWDKAFRKDGKKFVRSATALVKATVKLLTRQQKANKTWDCESCGDTVQNPTRPPECRKCNVNAMTMRRTKAS